MIEQTINSLHVSLGLFSHPGVLALFGLVVGSFLNVVIYRVPKMIERSWIAEAADGLSSPDELAKATGWSQARATQFTEQATGLFEQMGSLGEFNISRPRSRCPHCGHAIAWYENIPLVSWLVLRGKCSACSAPISARYPLVELATGIAFSLVGLRHPGALAFWYCTAAAVLIALAMIDFDTMLLPDSMTLPLMWLALIVSVFGGLLPLQSAVIGAAAGYLSLWSIYWTFKLLTGKEGMGYGDFKLMAALGAWFGAGSLPAIAFLSATVGIVVHILLRTTGSLKKDQPMPFGPYLAGAGLVLLVTPASAIQAVFPFFP